MQTIHLNFQSQGVPPVVPVMQSDSRSRFLGIVLYDGGAPYKAPAGATYTVQYRSANANAFGWYDTIVDNSGTHKAIVLDATSPHILTVELAEQALRTPGDVLVDLCVLASNGYQMCTFPVIVRVIGSSYPDESAVQSFFYVTGLSTGQWLTYVTQCQAAASEAKAAASSASQSVSEIKSTIDSTLTQAGKAADAKVTGEKIAAETARAKEAERANAIAISSEATRAAGAEQKLGTAISNEQQRAEQAEQKLGERAAALESCGFVVVDGKVRMKYVKS